MYCKNCGNSMTSGATYCNNCGVSAGSGTSFCPNCGKPVEPGWVNCPSCGCPLAAPQSYGGGYNSGYATPGAAGVQRSRIAAGLLAIFLGSLGVHNFYLGYNSRGLTQLVISLVGGFLTCGIATLAVEVWAIVEAVMIFTGQVQTDFYGNPLRD